MKQILHSALFLLGISVVGAQTVTVTDADINAGQTVNWVNTNTYLLDGQTGVEVDGSEPDKRELQTGAIVQGPRICGFRLSIGSNV